MHKVEKPFKNTRRFTLVLSAICLLAVGFSAQAEVTSASTRLTISRQKLSTPVTYDCVDTPIDMVLKDLATQAGLYMVKSPDVVGDVTLEVVDVPLEEVLTNVLGAYNYTYISTETMIRVVPLPETVTVREELVTKIYQVTYADVSDVTLALQNFISDQGEIATNKGTSHIIVTDTEEKIKAIDKFIEQIDMVTPQVLVEVRIFDIQSSEEFEIEAEWDAARNTPTVTSDKIDTTSISNMDNDSTVDLEKTISLDLGDTQADTTLQADNVPAGIGSTIIDDSTDNTYWTTKRKKPKFGGSFDKKDGGTIRFSVLNDVVDIDLALSILFSQTEARLLANPRVLVLDNETAVFETVREIPYTERTLTTGGDALISTQFKPVGVQLNVTPHVTRDNMIRLKIEPEFGVVVEQNEEGAPTIDTRRATTTTVLGDGQTIVLAGLRQKDLRKGVDKVPLLGDLPVLGALFRAEKETEENSELVVFITTRIITTPQLTEAEQGQLDSTDFLMPKFSEKQMKLQQSPSKMESKMINDSDDAMKDPEDIIDQWMKKKKTGN